jgi:hypothetical protein
MKADILCLRLDGIALRHIADGQVIPIENVGDVDRSSDRLPLRADCHSQTERSASTAPGLARYFQAASPALYEGSKYAAAVCDDKRSDSTSAGARVAMPDFLASVEKSFKYR